MSVAKNLMFQKKCYPNVYNGYLKLYKDEAYEAIEQDISDRENNVVLVVVEEFLPILQKVFVIPNRVCDEILNIEEFEFIDIYKAYDDDFKVNIRDSSLEINCMYMYPFPEQIIRIIKNTNKQTFQDTSIVYMLRDSSLYENVYLKESSNEIIRLNTEEELIESFSNVKITYNESLLIEKLNVENKSKMAIKSTFGENYYKVSLSLDLIRNMIEISLMQEDIPIINQYIYSSVMDEYRSEGKKIIDSYITKDFVHNYMIVDKFLYEGEQLSKVIVDMIRGEISREIIEFKSISRNADLYVNLLGSSIKKIDGILSHSLDELHKSVNII